MSWRATVALQRQLEDAQVTAQQNETDAQRRQGELQGALEKETDRAEPCEDKNAQQYSVTMDLVAKYKENRGAWEKFLLAEPFTGLKSVEVDPDFVDVYFGNGVAPGFFAWVIPAGDVVRAGLCTWDSKNVPAVYLYRKLLKRPEFKNAKRVSLASGKIPIGPPKAAVREG